MEEKEELPRVADVKRPDEPAIIDLLRVSVWDTEQKQEQKTEAKRQRVKPESGF